MLAAVLPASFAAAFQIGDVIGEVLLTDIRTYIDGEPIKSYNIAGRTAVIAQDLADYGFSVSFDEALAHAHGLAERRSKRKKRRNRR